MVQQCFSKPGVEPAKEVSREEAIAAISLVYLDTLKELGVSSYVLGVSFDEGAAGKGALKMAGSASLVLNLVAGLIHQLLPQDFDNLRTEMNDGVYFQGQRACAAMAPMPRGKPN